MTNTIGIRGEDKNQWERRVPLTPEHVVQLTRDLGIQVCVQPSTLRVFPDEAYRSAGAIVQEDLSNCSVILGIEEVPLHQFEDGKTYLFFSHTIKGQPYNMPMLKRMMEKGCQLIDYEKITDAQGRRLVLFGRHAGLAGMIESLHALGKRLDAEGVKNSGNPFRTLKQAYQYRDLGEAKAHLWQIGREISMNGLPEVISPLVVGFLGYGNVSKGAQEIFDCLPFEQLSPGALLSADRSALSNKAVYKVVFEEKDTVETMDGSSFSLQEYWTRPERYRAVFSKHLPYLTVLINGIYWEERFPVLVSADDLKNLYSNAEPPALRVIGDITCDLEGSISVTRKSTPPDAACYVYDTLCDTVEDGVSNLSGPVIMAVDNLPTEFPIESSTAFGDALLPFLPIVAANDFSESLENSLLPDPIMKAVILHHGRLTESFRYLEGCVDKKEKSLKAQ
jgi:saccharopine dehydrogenase (NAD+, L-lysine forming)